MINASEIMRSPAITVPPGMTVKELGRVLIDNDIKGAPVVDDDGVLVGIVTEYDLISRNKRLHIPTVLRLFDAFIPLEGSSAMEKEIKKMSASVVEDICTRKVVTITPETTLEEIATIMTEKRVHLLPVMKDAEVVGIVDNHDVMLRIAGEGQDR